jgi:hypothetical protein
MANTTFRKLRAAIAPKLQQNPGRFPGVKTFAHTLAEGLSMALT